MLLEQLKNLAPEHYKHKYDCLAETDWTNLPWFQTRGIRKEEKKPKVNSKDYILVDDYARQKSARSSPSLFVQKSLTSKNPNAAVPGLEHLELVSKPPPIES